MTERTPPPWPMTRAELATWYQVAQSTITRFLDGMAAAHARDPTHHPAPPQPVNPDQPNRPRYRLEEFNAHWVNRPPRGRRW